MAKYNTLPIVLKNPKILLIGAGKIALQKAKVMQKNNIDFVVISKEVDKKMPLYASNITLKNIKKKDFYNYSIVIDATGSKKVLQKALKVKEKHNFLYNAVDNPEVCDFFFAALITHGALKVAISSGGSSPTMAQAVRDKIARLLPKELAQTASDLQTKRDEGIIDIQKAKTLSSKLLGHVTLVGCGTGDVELLTIKAYKAILSADIVLTDHLISEEILEIIPATTKQVFVGKEKGKHSIKQEEINRLLIKYASEGLEVARLKAGDPYIFGRGAEEAQSLIAEGIRVDVIAGISSAIAGPASAGIAPTARGYATNLSIVSAHLQGNLINLDWCDLLLKKNHTTIVLMGLTRVEEIVKEALRLGVKKEMPVAIISNASRKNQKNIYTTLDALVQKAKRAERPAILVFGEVVKLQSILPHA